MTATSRAELQRAKNVDLVTFGPGVTGTKCANCEFVTERGGGAYCQNPKVAQPLANADKMCCALWDRPGTKRAWQ